MIGGREAARRPRQRVCGTYVNRGACSTHYESGAEWPVVTR